MPNYLIPSPTQFINTLLSHRLVRQPYSSMSDWFEIYKGKSHLYPRPIDRAILGGRTSLSVGFAFASGYQSAIESLFKPETRRLSSLCVTEEKGNHPRAIETRLSNEGDQFFLSGNKKFISGGCDAQHMYVACKAGADDQGRPILKVVSIDASTPGVLIEPMPTLAFIPEVSHGKVTLENVKISSEQILAGDGYNRLIKPFRTYEDVHVLAAILAYRLGEAIDSGWGQESIEAHLQLILSLQTLAELNLSDPATHIAVAGCRQQMTTLIEHTDPVFEQQDPHAFQNWLRDRPLLQVAQNAQATRTQKAWEILKAEDK